MELQTIRDNGLLVRIGALGTGAPIGSIVFCTDMGGADDPNCSPATRLVEPSVFVATVFPCEETVPTAEIVGAAIGFFIAI